MNDRYLFRGKRTDNGEWVIGNLVQGKTALHIIDGENFFVEFRNSKPYTEHEYIVDPATVGQSTGLKDKSGKLIFEGDMVRLWSNYNPNDEWRVVSENADISANRLLVAFSYGYVGGWILRPTLEPKFAPNTGRLKGTELGNINLANCSGDDLTIKITPGKEMRVEIIGNKWDNPELLEV